MKIILWILIFSPSFVFAGEPDEQILPSWDTAKYAMKECYSGWDVVIQLKSGLEQRIDMNEYTDQNVYTIVGEQTDTDTTLTSVNTYDSNKNIDAAYSRDRSRTSGYAAIVMTVPLYSREQRLKRKEKTNSEIEHLADLYANYDGHRATMLALNEQKEILKKVMIDSGQRGITAYYVLLENTEKSKALMSSAKRKILAILENCDYVATNKLAGTGQPVVNAN